MPFDPKQEASEPDTQRRPPRVCDFCGKTQRMVKGMVAGPKAVICNECVVAAAQVLGPGRL